MNDKYKYIKKGNQEFYLIGTAHISKLSVEDVIETINTVDPNTICIELDEERYNKLNNPKEYSDQNITKIIKEHKVGFLLVNLILASFQRRLASKLNNETGGEMMAGIRLAEERNCELVLSDRSISLTFSRIWNQLNFIDKTKLLSSIITSIFDKDEISEEELTNLKQNDILESAINEVGKKFPIIKRVLIDERDQYLAYKISHAKGDRVVAIVGAAHLNGIINNFETINSIDNINKKIKKPLSSKIIKWIIPTIIIALMIIMFINSKEVGLNQIKNWILINGTLSAIGVLLARGHILSILTAFIAAPITTIHPLLAAGWFAGITEAFVRKPKVSDFENLAQDTETIKGFFKNGVTRILLIVVFANIFATIGTLIGSYDLIKNFLNMF